MSHYYDVVVRGGSVGVYLWRYRWGLLPESGHFSHRIRASGRERLSIPVPETGVYGLRLSMFGFGGEIELDWAVRPD